MLRQAQVAAGVSRRFFAGRGLQPRPHLSFSQGYVGEFSSLRVGSDPQEVLTERRNLVLIPIYNSPHAATMLSSVDISGSGPMESVGSRNYMIPGI